MLYDDRDPCMQAVTEHDETLICRSIAQRKSAQLVNIVESFQQLIA